MLLITIFVELRVVAGRSRMRAGSPQAGSRRLCSAVALRRTAWSEHGMGASCAWHGKYESDTAALCKSNGKNTFLSLSSTAWARHAMCESALRLTKKSPRVRNYIFEEFLRKKTAKKVLIVSLQYIFIYRCNLF
jgi:hypothetical protein